VTASSSSEIRRVPLRPAPGTFLDNDCDVILVIERGWSDERIRELLGQQVDEVADVEYDLAVWRYHTAAQKRADGVGTDYENYWSPEGWGRTTIDVAVVSW